MAGIEAAIAYVKACLEVADLRMLADEKELTLLDRWGGSQVITAARLEFAAEGRAELADMLLSLENQWFEVFSGRPS